MDEWTRTVDGGEVERLTSTGDVVKCLEGLTSTGDDGDMTEGADKY